jgi:hypothetical protein
MIFSHIQVLAFFFDSAFPMSKPLPHEQKEVKAMSNKKRQSHQP